MSTRLEATTFPLWGSRLIEASAGTGKTWTIAALYVRLVLGHGGENGFARALTPPEILVMTFTRAATRELSDRIRARLLEAASHFRNPQRQSDPFLDALLADYPDEAARSKAAWLLAMAAEAMDEAAIHTIDAWCQRMLREHAFDSGNLFNEELVADEGELIQTAVHDYWRQEIYPLTGQTLDAVLKVWPGVSALQALAGQLIKLDEAEVAGSLADVLDTCLGERQTELARLKSGWDEKAQDMQGWLEAQLDLPAKERAFGSKLQARYFEPWLETLRNWSQDPDSETPDLKTGWHRLTPEGMAEAAKDPASMPALPAVFADFAALKAALAALPQIKPALLFHAGARIAARVAELKRQSASFGFADMLARLDAALSKSEVLRARILAQYPVALIDEFQDTSPLQYRLFDAVYQTADNAPDRALLLIGDPKQSIYGFRGADIHSYLAARRATAGRHYMLDTNFRSTSAVVTASNHFFARAEKDFPHGAFRFRRHDENPLPFEAVKARGRAEQLVTRAGIQPALTLWHSSESINGDGYRRLFAAQCAEAIAELLNDDAAGFSGEGFIRLKPADIAVLVRTGREAEVVRRELQKRHIASVYLSDQDSVFSSQEAADMLRWLQALAHPQESRLARAALATATLDLPLTTLAGFTQDELAWEAQQETIRRLHHVWQRQGILTALRQWLHAFALPARLLQKKAERSLTNILHIAELLQSASSELDGEFALIRWLSEQIAGLGSAGDEKIVRLESDADLVKVVTIHKSKGLEYPLVFLPFAADCRVASGQDEVVRYRDAEGEQHTTFSPSGEIVAQLDEARLQEDLRLFYVALTRARHAIWLGLAPLTDRNKPKMHKSAPGYLLNAGQEIDADALSQALKALKDGCDDLVLQALPDEMMRTELTARDAAHAPITPPRYTGEFERDWTLASFSAITRDLDSRAPETAQASNLKDAPEEMPDRTEDAPWHAFPRGPLPGNFLHEQLQWLAGVGFVLDEVTTPQLARRCERMGWGHRTEAVTDWLCALCESDIPVLGAPLKALTRIWPEMEFWFPSERLATVKLDALCRTHFLPGHERPGLPEREVHGMLKGFIDLVFEHKGRYWLLDYKSNSLGRGDKDYHAGALENATVAHRYDVQAAIYLLALHRLLQARLGADYQPEQHLGGAIYFYLRGIKNESVGCVCLPASADFLTQIDAALGTEQP